MKAQTAEEGAEITLTANTFTREGYTFSGWNTAADGKGTDHADKSTIKLTENLTFYAKWNKAETKISYTVKFDKNGGEGNLPADITATAGEEFALPAAELTKTGYDFNGWCATADGTGTTYEAGTKAKDLSTENGATVTLYAKWIKEGDYIITYKNVENAANDNPASYNVETETITLNVATKTGYAFSGWYKEASFETKVTEIAKGSTGNITLYAKWNLETYTVTYEPNGETNAETNPASYTSETETITLQSPSREYFDFGGWYTDREFSDSSKKTEITKGSSGDIMLYAKWTVAAENAVNAINSLPAGEHKIAVTGQMTTASLNGVMAAIKGNSNGAKVYLDLSGTKIDLANWQTGMTNSNMSRYNDNLTGIVIPPIELLEYYANGLLADSMFIECKNLKTVIILNSSDEYKIDYYAFKDCTSLEYVEIPASIVCIHIDAFDGCTALETITYKGTVEQWKQVKTDSKDSKYKLMNLKVQCENGTASGSDLTEE